MARLLAGLAGIGTPTFLRMVVCLCSIGHNLIAAIRLPYRSETPCPMQHRQTPIPKVLGVPMAALSANSLAVDRAVPSCIQISIHVKQCSVASRFVDNCCGRPCKEAGRKGKRSISKGGGAPRHHPMQGQTLQAFASC